MVEIKLIMVGDMGLWRFVVLVRLMVRVDKLGFMVLRGYDRRLVIIRRKCVEFEREREE